MATTWWIAKSANAPADGPYSESQIRRMIHKKKWAASWYVSPGGNAPLRSFSEVFKTAIQQHETAEEQKRRQRLESQQKAEAERQVQFEENQRKRELERQRESERQSAANTSNTGQQITLKRHRLKYYIATELMVVFITAHVARILSAFMVLFFLFKVAECCYGIYAGIEASIEDYRKFGGAAGMLGASFNFYYLGLYIFLVGISFALAAVTSSLIAWSRIAEEQGV